MEIALRLYNPLPRLILGLKEGMGKFTWRCCEAPGKKKYSTNTSKTTMEKRLYRLPEAAAYLGDTKGVPVQDGLAEKTAICLQDWTPDSVRQAWNGCLDRRTHSAAGVNSFACLSLSSLLGLDSGRQIGKGEKWE